MRTKSTQIRLASRPVGEPQDSDFAVVTTELPEVGEGQVLLRTVYLSLDPYMRGRMSAAKSYAKPVEVGDVMVGGTVCEVLESRAPNRAAGDLVLAYAGWQTHAVVDAQHTRRLDPAAAPVSTALGVLGHARLHRLRGAARDRPAAAGRDRGRRGGDRAGGLGGRPDRAGSRARGPSASPGGPEKCRALTEEFGFDAAVDHRSPTFPRSWRRRRPDGVDVYFENVGGPVTDAVVRRLNKFARIPVCGLVAGYNATEAPPGPDRLPAFLSRILTLSLTVRGFIQDEFVPTRHDDFLQDMTGWVRDGSVRYREDIVDGLERAPEAFRGLLAGRNFGKLLVQVGEDPTRT